MLLEVLRPLEGLAAEFALVRLERHMDADVRGDVVALDGGGAAGAPGTRQAEVVCALATNVDVAEMVLLGVFLSAPSPSVQLPARRLGICKEKKVGCLPSLPVP